MSFESQDDLDDAVNSPVGKWICLFGSALAVAGGAKSAGILAHGLRGPACR